MEKTWCLVCHKRDTFVNENYQCEDCAKVPECTCGFCECGCMERDDMLNDCVCGNFAKVVAHYDKVRALRAD